MDNKKYSVLSPYFYAHRNGESEKAEAMFDDFKKEGFSYEMISNHPDYLVYASAELVHDILPLMIDEMLKRSDTDNFLVYHIISALDPLGSDDIEGSFHPIRLERAQKVIELADKRFAEKALGFLLAMEKNPPNGIEQVRRLLSFWRESLQKL